MKKCLEPSAGHDRNWISKSTAVALAMKKIKFEEPAFVKVINKKSQIK